ncbi:MAG: glycosyltransferase, partial [Chloroflexota bacterium]
TAEDLTRHLRDVYDVERLTSRVTAARANARDLVALRESLRRLPLIAEVLAQCEASLLADLRGQIAARGLLEHVVFHEWIPEALLPEYYSLGAVTLAIGSYVETFGNVPYESTACGTPAIIARVGPGREILPEELAYKVDQGDVESAAALAAQILEGGLRTSPATLAYLHTHFQQVDMVARYARIILEAERQPPLPYRFTPIDTTTRFILAPWCYDAGARGVYHDFRADYNTDRRLADLTQGGAFTFDRAAATTDRDQVMAWYRDGFIVPLTPATEAHA